MTVDVSMFVLWIEREINDNLDITITDNPEVDPAANKHTSCNRLLKHSM